MSRAGMRSRIKVGSIFYESWGYDQTNVAAYEVVGTYATYGVVLRPIALEVEATTGPFSERVKPVAGDYVGESFKRVLTSWGVMIGRQHAWLWDGRSLHSSWGH